MLHAQSRLLIVHFEHRSIVPRLLRALTAFTSNKIATVIVYGIELEYNNHRSTHCH